MKATKRNNGNSKIEIRHSSFIFECINNRASKYVKQILTEVMEKYISP